MQNLTKISGVTPGQTNPFLPSKIWPKIATFYLIVYMAEFLNAGNNTDKEVKNIKSSQNIWG